MSDSTSGFRTKLTATLLGTSMAVVAAAVAFGSTSGTVGAAADPAAVVQAAALAPAAQVFGSDDDLLGVAAAKSNGRVSTNGAALTVRKGPSSAYAPVRTVANGTKVFISCQSTGQSVKGTYGTSTVWDYVPALGGFISDAYTYTGSDGRVAKNCTVNAPTTPTTGCKSRAGQSSCATAVARAKAVVGRYDYNRYHNLCMRLQANWYGLSSSGFPSANDGWNRTPASLKHAGSRTVPAGALAYFRSSSYGHVMISIGGGKFVSNDIKQAGRMSITTISEIESRWGQQYLGWSQPYFATNP